MPTNKSLRKITKLASTDLFCVEYETTGCDGRTERGEAVMVSTGEEVFTLKRAWTPIWLKRKLLEELEKKGNR